MSADSQTLQAKYQKLAAEFAKVCLSKLNYCYTGNLIFFTALKAYIDIDKGSQMRIKLIFSDINSTHTNWLSNLIYHKTNHKYVAQLTTKKYTFRTIPFNIHPPSPLVDENLPSKKKKIEVLTQYPPIPHGKRHIFPQTPQKKQQRSKGADTSTPQKRLS